MKEILSEFRLCAYGDFRSEYSIFRYVHMEGACEKKNKIDLMEKIKSQTIKKTPVNTWI